MTPKALGRDLAVGKQIDSNQLAILTEQGYRSVIN